MGAHNKYRGTVHAYGRFLERVCCCVSHAKWFRSGRAWVWRGDVEYFSGDRGTRSQTDTPVIENVDVEEESSESSSEESSLSFRGD